MANLFHRRSFSGWQKDQKRFAIAGFSLVLSFIFGAANANAFTDEERAALLAKGKADMAAAAKAAGYRPSRP